MWAEGSGTFLSSALNMFFFASVVPQATTQKFWKKDLQKCAGYFKEIYGAVPSVPLGQNSCLFFFIATTSNFMERGFSK